MNYVCFSFVRSNLFLVALAIARAHHCRSEELQCVEHIALARSRSTLEFSHRTYMSLDRVFRSLAYLILGAYSLRCCPYHVVPCGVE